MFLKQKAKVYWLKEGDKCSKCFHSVVASKTKRDTIRVLVDDHGKILESFDDITTEVIGFFTRLIGTADPGVKSFAAVTQFFQDSFMLPTFNAISITLVPKVPNPSKTAFVKGKNIVDNTLLAQELVKGYGRKTISPSCSLKIDLYKTFESLHWDFIYVILTAIVLPMTFISWIEACFTAARYSISFNGSLIGYFKGARGIRKRDPISPLLFVLSINVLSRILNKAAERGIFGYHPRCKKVGLTHLAFTDDILIFYKGNVEFVVGVISVLDYFYENFGLKLNASKCDIFVVGISSSKLEDVKMIDGFNQGYMPVRYLGVPLVTRKLSDKDYVALIDNIRIDQLCSRFFWKGSNKAGTGARVSWEKLCLLKSEGGLGLKDIKSWNKACMIKLIRNILESEGSLCVARLKSYVIKDTDFWNMEAGINSSWSFRLLLKMRLEAYPVLSSGAQQIREIWNLIRTKGTKVTWHKLIWFPLHIPKHSMIAWMTLLDRLPTKDRLKHMGLNIDDKCVFCKHSLETRDHVFLHCPTGISLWEVVLNLNGMRRRSLSWDNHLAWACGNWKGLVKLESRE
ncbi:uncharacterized protein LOC120166937 [Hibiscus syriacus]|uniref:uncharacterized protein LOC120166937 n=1 Tax=Hibiscus syriacus TaxID=106335 RepID=UPI001922DE82|nr:uncharacterized protein LOC120166937 [Hibiscus syriacus]